MNPITKTGTNDVFILTKRLPIKAKIGNNIEKWKNAAEIINMNDSASLRLNK